MNIQTAETKVRPRSSFYFLLQRVLIRWFSGFCTRVMFNHIQLHICGKILPTIRKSHLPHSGSFLLTVLNINGTFTAFDYHCCNLILRCWYTLMSVRQRERKRYRERDSGKGGEGHGHFVVAVFYNSHSQKSSPEDECRVLLQSERFLRWYTQDLFFQ